MDINDINFDIVENVIYDGVELNELYHDEVLVWQRKQDEGGLKGPVVRLTLDDGSISSVTFDTAVMDGGYGIVTKNAFKSNGKIVSVEFGDEITSIGTSAFYECISITAVTLNNGLLNIGTNAFYDNSITSITIPNTVTTIGDAAFYNTDITSLTIPDNVITIGTGITRSCFYLKSAYIGSGITKINTNSFQGCSKLEVVQIPSSVTTISKQAFYSCSKLTRINYGGTISQWNAITKDTDWNRNVNDGCMIYCTDGTIDMFGGL